VIRKLSSAVRLGLSFVWELLLSNLAVVKVVLKPKLDIRPGVVAYPLRLESEMAITWLANLITLTPGTLSLYLSEDRKTLYIHTLNVDDPSDVVRTIHGAFERHLMELEK
jgi:multicomponent Na+:H+ antiporter subunit E